MLPVYFYAKFVGSERENIHACTVDLEIFVLGNFHNMIKFCVEKIFVGTTPYHINVNSVHVFFIFVAAINYENILQRNLPD